MAVPTGLEPATSGVTGRCSDQLNYGTISLATHGGIGPPSLSVFSACSRPTLSGLLFRSNTRGAFPLS